MSYREPDPRRLAKDEAKRLARVERERARSEVAQLASVGGQAAAAKQRKGRARADREERKARAVRDGNIRAAMVGRSPGFVVVLVVGVIVGGGGGTLMIALADGSGRKTGLGIAAIAAAMVSILGARWFFGARVIDDERRWLATLGWQCDGYLEALGVDPRDTHLGLVLDFDGERPPTETLQGLAGLVGAELQRDGNVIEVLSPELRVDNGDAPSSNASLHGWLRKATHELLVPLHRAYPLTRVTVKRR